MSNIKTTYTISITQALWSEEDIDAGEPGETSLILDKEEVSAEDLRSYAREYGISTSSESAPSQVSWFVSTCPPEDRDHFERGIDKYFSLHIIAVNGEEPTVDNIKAVAGIIGVKF